MSGKVLYRRKLIGRRAGVYLVARIGAIGGFRGAVVPATSPVSGIRVPYYIRQGSATCRFIHRPVSALSRARVIGNQENVTASRATCRVLERFIRAVRVIVSLFPVVADM